MGSDAFRVIAKIPGGEEGGKSRRRVCAVRERKEGSAPQGQGNHPTGLAGVKGVLGQ